MAAASAARVDLTTRWIFFDAHSIMLALPEPSRILLEAMSTARPICEDPLGCPAKLASVTETKVASFKLSGMNLMMLVATSFLACRRMELDRTNSLTVAVLKRCCRSLTSNET